MNSVNIVEEDHFIYNGYIEVV